MTDATVLETPTDTDTDDPSNSSPTPRRLFRRARFWIVLGVVLVGGLITVSILGRPPTTDDVALSSINPAPDGARAVAEVLKQHGVSIVATSTLRDTEAAVADRGQTTILIYDPGRILAGDQRRLLLGLADRLVVIEPDGASLDDFAPDLSYAGALSGTLAADCSLPAAQQAGRIDARGVGYTANRGDAITCFTTDGASALAQDGAVSVLGAGNVLSNSDAATSGNAALSLNLLGSSDRLVWYLPSWADAAGENAPTLSEVQPVWVVPLAVLAFLVAIAGAFWRGRRMGPLVVENLPVLVRASETMEGRARLYARGRARLRALDTLRVGTLDRLAVTCGLPRRATVTEIIDAVAALTGTDRGRLQTLLVDEDPRTDRDLVRLSDDLIRLERDAATASRPL